MDLQILRVSVASLIVTNTPIQDVSRASPAWVIWALSVPLLSCFCKSKTILIETDIHVGRKSLHGRLDHTGGPSDLTDTAGTLAQQPEDVLSGACGTFTKVD